MSNSKKSHYAANRAKMRNLESVKRKIENYDAEHQPGNGKQKKQGNQNTKAYLPPRKETLRIIPLGGQDAIGAKNLFIIEYEEDAIVVDAGFDLSVVLPGINYLIPESTYLEKIKHKIKGYVITHGHLDHIGALPYVVPKAPAPIYGSRFTIGMVEKQFDESDYNPETVVMNQDSHEKLKLGVFMVELIRATHSIPGNTMVSIETPLGRVLHTGDYRLDPEPLDHMPTDIERIKQLGQEGVLMLLSESTNAQKPGRTPTEHTLKASFEKILKESPGRVFVATFSSNINRIQMIVDAAVQSNRKIAVDGRSMLATMELAVKLGFVKIPRGTVVPMHQASSLKDEDLVVVQTGSQGEENAALQRMSLGDHKYVKLKRGDTVVLSSTPIPGNEVSYEELSNSLALLGVKVYRAPTHEVDGCGPLHVSGHANRDEMREMIDMTRPKYFSPIYAGRMHQNYHRDIAVEAGLNAKNIFFIENGGVLNITKEKAWLEGKVPAGSEMVDQNGQIVPGVVVKDRLLLSEDGFVVVVLTLNRKTGQLLSSPDIITRGFIFMKDNEELMNDIRTELKRFALRKGVKGDIAGFKKDLQSHLNGLLFKRTNRSPLIIPVVNVVDSSSQPQNQQQNQSQQKA